MNFQILRADADRGEWLRAWERTRGREPFAHPAYCELFRARGVEPLCATGGDGNETAMFPFLLRELRCEAWAAPSERARDVAVPNGYGGAFTTGGHRPGNGQAFWAAFGRWAEDNGVVCGDARISLFRDEILPMAGWTERRASDNVVVDLERIRRGETVFSGSVRRNIRLARRHGLTVRAEHTPGAWRAFQRLYVATMDRRGATAAYYFSGRFFRGLAAWSERGFARLFLARDRGGVPAYGVVVLVGAKRAYDFLAGGDESARRTHASEFVRSTACSWAAGRGFDGYVLGGGNAPEDELFQYKLRFAPDGRREYSTGRVVYDESSYRRLVELRRRFQRENGLGEYVARRFPAYR